MEKIILRKDYKTRVVPVEEAVGHYLTKKAARTWTEEFVDESTKETVKIDRCEVLLERGKLITDKLANGLKKQGVNEVEISDCPFRAEEEQYFSRLVHVKVTVRSSNSLRLMHSPPLRRQEQPPDMWHQPRVPIRSLVLRMPTWATCRSKN